MLEITFYLMGVVLAVSLVAKTVSTITVRKMVKEAAEIQKSNHRLMKLIKAKFEHASLVSDRVQNVGAFVDKYIYEYRTCGIRLNVWRGVPKKGLLVLVILGVFSVCEDIRTNGWTQVTVEYIQWASVFILVLALIHFVSGENARLEGARNYMVDYLENVCVHRYAMRNQKETEEIEETVEEEEMQAPDVETDKISAKDMEEEEFSQREMRIRAILEEFLA